MQLIPLYLSLCIATCTINLYSMNSSILNYTDRTIQVSYTPPGKHIPNRLFALAPNNGGTVHLSGTGDVYESNTGIISVTYKNNMTTYQNPKPAMTYHVTIAQDGKPVIEGNSPNAGINIIADDNDEE